MAVVIFVTFACAPVVVAVIFVVTVVVAALVVVFVVVTFATSWFRLNLAAHTSAPLSPVYGQHVYYSQTAQPVVTGP